MTQRIRYPLGFINKKLLVETEQFFYFLKLKKNVSKKVVDNFKDYAMKLLNNFYNNNFQDLNLHFFSIETLRKFIFIKKKTNKYKSAIFIF